MLVKRNKLNKYCNFEAVMFLDDNLKFQIVSKSSK